MILLTASELREDLSTAINKVAFGGERIILQRNKKDVAALVSIDDLILLRQLEDRADLAEIRKAMNEPGSDMSWEDAKKELGL
jgi:PHD/YefM family antitoxin component YafN of YafNO toxin-antitoxin module